MQTSDPFAVTISPAARQAEKHLVRITGAITPRAGAANE